ncbi:MAG TPA: NAD-dependent epimerase/dehydratase family protein [Candidatus Dormibacteraeota bacterium]
MTRVLVTGGAGFIGSHLVDALLTRGFDVRVLDNLDPQAHEGGRARFLSSDAELMVGDLRDRDAVRRALNGMELVFHQAGMVGNGQSMYEIHRYVEVNGGGTAILMEEIVARRDRIRRVIAASSMVVYGEGAYWCAQHGECRGTRSAEDLRARRWEPLCQICGAALTPRPTNEEWPLQPTSPYAISKRDSEEITLVSARAHGVDAVALRYLNVYGPRQALGNPYTGVAAVFCARLLSGRAPLIFEDGGQRRDLVHVSDIVRANLLAMDSPLASGYPINIGTGTSVTVLELAQTLARGLGIDHAPEISGLYRAGDIRHCYADISRAERLLGFSAEADRDECLSELAQWVATQPSVDRSEGALAALKDRGLIR